MKNVNWEAMYKIARSEIEQMFEEEFHGVWIRTYDPRGNSKDEQREATAEEMELIRKISMGALPCARYTKDIQHCTDAAEWILDEFIENCNGYLTIYCPIKRVWNRMLKTAEQETA